MQKYNKDAEKAIFPEIILPNKAYTLNSMALSYASNNPKKAKFTFVVATKAMNEQPLDASELACLRSMLQAHTTIKGDAWKPAFFEALTGDAYFPTIPLAKQRVCA